MGRAIFRYRKLLDMANPDHIPPPEMAKCFGIGKLARHLFICAGPDCIAPDLGEQTWEYVKKRMKQLGNVELPQEAFRAILKVDV